MSRTGRILHSLLCLIIVFTLLPIVFVSTAVGENTTSSITLTLSDLNESIKGHVDGSSVSSYFISLDNSDVNFYVCKIDLDISTKSNTDSIVRIYDHLLNVIEQGTLGSNGFLTYKSTLYPQRSLADVKDFQFLIQVDNRARSNGKDYSIEVKGTASTALQGYVKFEDDSLIPNASIEIHSLNSEETVYITADSNGQYIAPRCPVDMIEMSVAYEGTWETLYPTYDLSGCSSCQQKVTTKDLVTSFRPPEIVSKPNKPTGPSSGEVGQVLVFSAEGASSNVGHSIEYRFSWGDGAYSNWTSSNTASHPWSVTGQYNITAQARCIQHPNIISNWSESKNITIGLPKEEVVTTPNIPSGSASGEVGQSLTFSTGGAFSNLGHSVEYIFDWGDETQSAWSSSSTLSHSWSKTGTFGIRAQARCITHKDVLSAWSEVKQVTIHSQPETISIPNAPSGVSTGQAEQSLTYSTGGSISNLEHNIQYRFDWGDGTQSEWSASTSASHSWSSEGPRNVRAQARCVVHINVISGWSTATTVSITPPPEAITAPNIPSGPANSEFGRELTYTAGGASSNLGHSLHYRFDWGDGKQSNWSSSTSAVYTYYGTGTYEIKAQARCSAHTDIVSGWSQAKIVTITTPPEMIKKPDAPTGPFSGEIGQNLKFSCGGSLSNLGHSLQYRFDWGDGKQSDWSSSTSASKSWASAGDFQIKTQARCTAHTSVVSEWSESRTLTIIPPPETVSTPNIPTGASSGEVAEMLTFTADGASSNLGNNIEYRFDWGDGTQSNWSVNPNASYSWSGEGSYNIRAQARSSIDSTVISNWSGIKSVTVNPHAEMITQPNTPTGPLTGKMEENLIFSTGGTSSSYGHNLQYLFDWGDGTQSNWSFSATASHYWTRPGTFEIRAQARCATHVNIISNMSFPLKVTIESSPESITTPNQPSGLSEAKINEIFTFTTGGAISNLGHILQYRFDWGDRTQSEWSSSTSATHTWTTAGIYNITAQARCFTDPDVASAWSTGLTITVVAASTDVTVPANDNGTSSIKEKRNAFEIISTDSDNIIMVLQDTKANLDDGTSVNKIRLQPVEEVPPIPKNQKLISKAMLIDPVETTFQPPVILKLKYNPSLIADEKESIRQDQDHIHIAYFDPESGKWFDYDSVINPGSLTATTQTGRGGVYAVLYENIGASMAWAITGAVILSIVALALIVYLIITRKEELVIAGQMVKTRINEALKRPPDEPPKV